MKNSNSRPWIPAVFLLMVLVLAVTASCGVVEGVKDRLSSRAGGGAAPATAAELVYFEGSVTVNGETADVGTTVKDGDLVITGPGSMAEFKFGDYRILRIRENSVLTLDSSAGTMKLDAGAIAVVQSKAQRLARQNDWVLETPTMIAAVRGTMYFAKVENPDQTYFCLCNGRIHLEDSQDHGALDIEASHHDAVRFFRQDGKVVYMDAPMLYHTDEDMESLADKVHVPVDWSTIPD